MKKIIIGAVAILVVLTLVIIAFVGISGSSYWEDDWDDIGTELDGAWGQEIILTYVDGTEQTLKILYDNPSISVWHSGEEVSWITYKLNGKATGTGYSGVRYKLNSYTLRIQTKLNGVVKNTVDFSLPDDISSPKPVDGNWHVIYDYPRTAITYLPSSLQPGTYTLTFSSISGNIQYSADGEAYTTVSSPPSLTITMEVRSDRTLSVVLGAGYTV